MLRIIIAMIGEVLRFLLIWAVVLISLSSTNYLLFGDVDEYGNAIEVIFVKFGTGLGSFDWSLFEDAEHG